MRKLIQRMVLIVRPDWDPRKRYPAIEDYVPVPRLATYGTYTVAEMLPMETLAELHRLREGLRK